MTQHDTTPRLRSHFGLTYDERMTELSRLLPMWPAELSDTTREGRLKIIAKIERAIRAERRRGRAGHWAYDLARHAALFRLLKCERAALGQAHVQPQKRKGPPQADGP